MKTFEEWMIEKYLGKDTPRGDLAYDISRDKDFPENDPGIESIVIHLECSNASDKVIALTKRAWKDYCKCVGRPVYRKILDTETGIVYDNVREAARAVNHSVHYLVAPLTYEGEHPQGKRWIWAD